MNEVEPKVLPGENINTDGFGLAIVRDYYFSMNSRTYVYAVSPLDNLAQTFLIFEEDVL